MKKWLKITLISLGSLIGVLLIVVAIACWLIFTPSRLTGIVNSLTAKFINCETKFESVELTLFKTFPDLGVEVNNVYFVNPMEGAPSDTLASLSSLTVGVNLKEYLANKNIIVRKIQLEDVAANIYIDAYGDNNFSIFTPSDDTTESEPFQLPDEIDISKVVVKNLNCRFLDEMDGISAQVGALDLSLDASLQELSDGKAQLKVEVGDIEYSQDADGAFSEMSAILQGLKLKTKVSVADMSGENVSLDGKVELGVDKLDYRSENAASDVMEASLQDASFVLDGKGDKHLVDGRLNLRLPKALFSMSGEDFVNQPLADSPEDLLKLDVPFTANLDEMKLSCHAASIALDQIALTLDGLVQLAAKGRPMSVNLDYATNQVVVQNVLPYIPRRYSRMLDGMSVGAKIALDGHAEGLVTNDTLPCVTCNVLLREGSFAHAALPVKLQRISADLSALVDLSRQQKSHLQIKKMRASYNSNTVSLSGRVDDLLGNMRIAAGMKGHVVLSEIMPLLTDSLPIDAAGTADLDLTAKATLKQITDMDLASIKVGGSVKVDGLEASYDSMQVSSPSLQLSLAVPSTKQRLAAGEWAEVGLTSDMVGVRMPATKTNAKISNANIALGVSNVTDKKQPMAAAVNLSLGHVEAHVDTLGVSLDGLKVNGKVARDEKKEGVINQWNPQLDVAFQRTAVYTPHLPEAVRLASFKFDYKPDLCEISESSIYWGLSDYHLKGQVRHLEDWLEHKRPLDANVSLVSDYTDVDQLMSLVSGLGSNADTLAAMRKEDSVPAEAKPFIVPLDVNVNFQTNIKRCVAFGNDLTNLGGGVSVVDGKVVLDQVGFVCKAARMELTGVYRSPRPNHLYLGVDFHLLDIQIDELVDMIPYVDTLLPMLNSFKGQADFHLAIETFLNARYSPKVSTLMGATAISGKNLEVLPGETFDMMAKYLMFNKKTKNVIDSLDVEMTLFRDRIDVYPFMLSMDKYQVCVSGIHSLDNACNYHLELLKSPLPLRLAVDVKGTLSSPRVSLGSVKYDELFNPKKKDAVKARTLEIKQMVRQSLEKNVKTR